VISKTMMRGSLALRPGSDCLFSDWHYQDGEKELIGELHLPESPNGKAMLVAHEAIGIGGNVRRCAILAELRYIAAAADLHGSGRVLPNPEIGPAAEKFHQDPSYCDGASARHWTRCASLLRSRLIAR
jgi:hypothetical protein